MFNPLYPIYVSFYVSKSIWNLYEIYIWQFVLSQLGKQLAFYHLQRRYERSPKYVPAVILLVAVFSISWIVVRVMRFRQWLRSTNRSGNQNDRRVTVDIEQNKINEVNNDGKQNEVNNEEINSDNSN